MRWTIVTPILVLALAQAACGDDESASSAAGGGATSSTTAATGGSGGAATTGTGMGGFASGCDLASDTVALQAFLDATAYSGWQAESAPHSSAGPHGTVRTYVNDDLFGSLQANNSEHPMCSVAVKELYSGANVVGHAVAVKTAAAGDGGQGWYWYEITNGTVLVDGNGQTGCTNCHGTGADYIQSPFPLQ